MFEIMKLWQTCRIGKSH